MLLKRVFLPNVVKASAGTLFAPQARVSILAQTYTRNLSLNGPNGTNGTHFLSESNRVNIPLRHMRV